jgi:hypothetical protein
MSSAEQMAEDSGGTANALIGALVTVATVLAGFAFTGILLVLGFSRPETGVGHMVAVGLLLAAFFALIYSAVAFTSSICFLSLPGLEAMVALFLLRDGVRVMLAGFALVCASTCLMVFLWSVWVGCVGAILAAGTLVGVLLLYRATLHAMQES